MRPASQSGTGARSERRLNPMPFLRERSGRWSPVKIVAFVAAVLPALWIAYQAWAGELGARPVTEAIHQAGDWALRLLLITLAITPGAADSQLSPASSWRAAPSASPRRATRCCICSLYVLDQHFDLFKVASEIVLRIYLLIGGDRAHRPDRARRDVDRSRHQPARLAALERAPPRRLWHRDPRRRCISSSSPSSTSTSRC